MLHKNKDVRLLVFLVTYENSVYMTI